MVSYSIAAPYQEDRDGRGLQQLHTISFTESRMPPPRRARLVEGAATVRSAGIRPADQVAGEAPCAAAMAKSDRTKTLMLTWRCDGCVLGEATPRVVDENFCGLSPGRPRKTPCRESRHTENLYYW